MWRRPARPEEDEGERGPVVRERRGGRWAGGPGRGLCRYPEDRIPPHTSSKSRQGAGRVYTHCHASYSSGPRLPTEVGAGAATCPAVPAPAAQPEAAPGPPHALLLQVSLPGPGRLRGYHVFCGSSSRCLAQGSSGAATCPTAPAPAARPGAGPGPPRVPWRPDGR
jgi:hypothetical protein